MFTDGARPPPARLWRRLWLLGLLALALGVIWLASALLLKRDALRVRLEIEQLGGRVEVATGEGWLSWLAPHYAERVVAINLANVRRFNPAWVGSFPDLAFLAIYNVPMTDQDLADLKSLRHLRRLNLMQIHIQGPELAHLANLSNLQELRLSDVNDEAPAHLAGCDHLEVLHILNSQQLTDRGLERLPPLPRLRQLQLVRTATTEAGVQQLQRRFTSLELLHQSDQ